MARGEPQELSRKGFWRILTISCGSFLVAVVVGIGALWLYTASLSPLDLLVADKRSTVVLDRNGSLLRAFTTDEGRWRLPIGVGDIDPHYIAMLKAYEDKNFDSHFGVDIGALARAAFQWVGHGRIVSGASTLSMQVARLLEPREERSISAKLRQIARAFELERRLTKDQILTLYLTLAPYGGNLEGARAASLAYFGREPKRLSFAEAALLVALPQSPETRRPDRYAEVTLRARNRVLDRAIASGVISETAGENAKADPLPKTRTAFPVAAAHAAESAVAQKPEINIHHLTIDRNLQMSMEALAREASEMTGPRVSAAIVVIDNRTGELLASVGSPDYLSGPRNGAIDMTKAIRSPGSALKPFIYALAFENGIAHPETILDDSPARFGSYRPENFDLGYQGNVTARKALQLSLNIPAVELLNEVGASRFIVRLRQAGADIVLPQESAPGLAVGLGGLGISLFDLTRLYSGLAREGLMPVVRHRIDTIEPYQPAKTVTDSVSAWYTFDILQGAPPPENALSGRIAYKTGTSYGYRDAWAVGYDQRITIGVWIGRPDNNAVPGLIGRQIAAPVLFDAFARFGGESLALKRPPFALSATSATLPPPLRHLRSDIPKTLAAASQPALKISFPVDGSRVDLGYTSPAEGRSELALKAIGGLPPFTWLANGVPIGEAALRRQAFWKPDGAGFARLSVMDATGAVDSVVVRIE